MIFVEENIRLLQRTLCAMEIAGDEQTRVDSSLDWILCVCCARHEPITVRVFAQ